MSEQGAEQKCEHNIVSRLKDAGDYGQVVNTDWLWCSECGAVKVVGMPVWSLPARRTPNLPARLNALEAKNADLRQQFNAALESSSISEVQPRTAAVHEPWHGCHADRDGDCIWDDCPQIRDNEPHATGRHCPLDTGSKEAE